MSELSDELDLILLLSTSSASLDRSPKKNWVENAGQLPPYIRKLARAIEKNGKSLSQAIAIAIGRCKKWAAGGGDVDADTQAKAAKAIAQWEALKGKNKAKKIVKATNLDGEGYLFLTNAGSFNTDRVRRAWDSLMQANRQKFRAERRAAGEDEYAIEAPYSYIEELWTDHIIANVDGPTRTTIKVPYSVSGTDIEFGDPVEVKQVYVEMDEELSELEKLLLQDVFLSRDSALHRLTATTTKL